MNMEKRDGDFEMCEKEPLFYMTIMGRYYFQQ